MKYQAPALSRGLAILEVLSPKQKAVTLNQIATELNLTTGQIFRLLYVLVESGYVEKQDSDMFKMTGKLFFLGNQFITNYSFLDIVFPVLKEISAQTQQSCHCSIKVNGKVVVVAKTDSPNRFGFSVRVGYSVAMEQSSSGKIMLAHRSEEGLTSYMKKISQEHDKDFLKKLHADLEFIRKKKYIIANSSYVKGIKDIAVAIIPKNSHIGPFAITIPFVSSSYNTCTVKFTLKTLQQGAEKITKMMS